VNLQGRFAYWIAYPSARYSTRPRCPWPWVSSVSGWIASPLQWTNLIL